MGFRISKEKERQNREPTPLEKALGAPVLNFGLGPRKAPAMLIRKRERPAAAEKEAAENSD